MALGSISNANRPISRPMLEASSSVRENNKSETTKTEDPRIRSTQLAEANNTQEAEIPKVKNTQEATAAVTEKNISFLRTLGLASATIAGVSASTFAFFTRIFSKEPDRKGGFAKNTEIFAKRTTAFSYGMFAFINTVRALRAKDLALAFSNLIEIPISIFSSPENLTLNRGLSIGLGNICLEAQRITSKEKYKDFGESINYLTRALKRIYENFKLDPIRTMTNMKQGSGASIFSAITALSPLIQRLTGSDFLAYNFRHWPGIIMEFGKINLSNLEHGAFNYWSSGLMMTVSSLINLLGGMSKDLKHTTEILTWIPNVLGRRLLAAANVYRETSKDRKANPVTMVEAIKLAWQELLHINNGFNKDTAYFAVS